MASQNEASIWALLSTDSRRETHREAGAVRHSTGVLQIFRRILPPRLSPQELWRYGARGAGLQPLVRENMAPPVLFRMPASPQFRPQSTKCLPLCHRKRSAPSREKSLLRPAKMQNSDALTVQSNLMHSVSRQQDYPQSARETRQNRDALANPCISFNSFASAIASAMVAWEGAVSPKCQWT